MIQNIFFNNQRVSKTYLISCILVEKGIAPYKSYDFCYVLLTTAPILYCIVVTIMYCIIFHTMLYIPVLLLLNKHSFIHSLSTRPSTRPLGLALAKIWLCTVTASDSTDT